VSDDTDRADDRETGPAVTRSEEQLRLERTEHEIGKVRVRKQIEEDSVEETFDRRTEHADMERLPPEHNDSGEIETLPDGSVSIPVFEEQLVVQKRLVVRERIIIRKEVVTEQQQVTADLKRERVEIDADTDVADVVHVDDRP
jgi:uncharacterized protein (TIGR02271 family)